MTNKSAKVFFPKICRVCGATAFVIYGIGYLKELSAHECPAKTHTNARNLTPNLTEWTK